MTNNIQLSKIDPSNDFLTFLTRRILDNKYRGVVSSQHNRYTIDNIEDILSELYEYKTKYKKPLKIRTVDISKRPMNTEEEADYAQIVSNIDDKMGRTTQDSLRKNFFPDFERMGLIVRHKIGNSIKSVEITRLGIDFIHADLMTKLLIFSKSLNNLLEGSVDLIISILTNYKFDYITEYELMFIISAVGANNTNFEITESEAVKLITSYRRLRPSQKEYMIKLLNNELQPKGQQNKTLKRDWHNWKNKNDQIFYLLTQSVFFEISQGNKLSLRGKIKLDGNNYELLQKKRSQVEKINYFNNHSIDKSLYKGYELHHIVEYSEARTPEQLKLIDNWKNMILIDGQTHNEITIDRNKINYYLYNYSIEYAKISDIMNEHVKKLEYDKNLIIDRKLNKIIKEYNSVLIDSI